jgi:SAM-dependent methyltransferase
VTQSWLEFWSGKPSIYVSPRHLEAHYRAIGDDVLAFLAHRGPCRILDFGCGDALAAAQIAAHGHQLALFDGAAPVRERLAARYAGTPGITVLSEDSWQAMKPGSVDVVIVNSVLQYLDDSTLDALIDRWREILLPTGELLLADVITPDVGLIGDVLDLLLPAWKHGFLLAALNGLAATLVSDYRRLRKSLGLVRHDPEALAGRLARHGMSCERSLKNIGLNAHRSTFIARPAG